MLFEVLTGWAVILVALVVFLAALGGRRNPWRANLERRTGPPDRRRGLPDRRCGMDDPRELRVDRRRGQSERRSGSGERRRAFAA